MNIQQAAQVQKVQVKTIQKKLQSAGFETSSTMQLSPEHLKVLNIRNGYHTPIMLEEEVDELKGWQKYIPSLWDTSNFFEIGLISYELWLLWEWQSILITGMFLSFIIAAQQLAKHPDRRYYEANGYALWVVAALSFVSLGLHIFFLKKHIKIENVIPKGDTINEWTLWVVAVAMGLIISGMSFMSVFISHKKATA